MREIPQNVTNDWVKLSDLVDWVKEMNEIIKWRVLGPLTRQGKE